MLLHYLRLALRGFRRHKLYSLINIGCLSIGLGVVMTILLYILHEHSYDRWHANAGRIFRVSTHQKYGSASFWNARMTYPTGPAILQADPAVESMVRVYEAGEGVDLQNPALAGYRFGETSRFLYADSNFFRFFSFRLLRGGADMVLSRPFTVVLTEKAAKTYFGKADPIGKTLLMDGKYPLEVTGIAADVPSNSSLVFDFVASLSTMRGVEGFQDDVQAQQLQSGSFRTWLLLRHPADTAEAARSLARLSLLAEGRAGKRQTGPYEETHQFFLGPLTDVHLKGMVASSRRYLDAFTLVAGLILLLALVNYMSLATARSAMRAKEVGIRKVIGAGRGRIAEQFYIESAMYAIISFLGGGLIFLWFRPYFCRLMQLPIDASFLASPIVLAFFTGLLLLVILVAGSYPALLLSSFRPVAVLYGKLSRQRSGERMRKGFITFQFTLSMSLVICSIVIGKQLYFLRHADTGVDRENIVMFPFGSTMGHYGAYRQDIAALPGVRQVATTNSKLYNGYVLNELVHVAGETVPAGLNFLIVDSSFISLLGLEWRERPAAGSLRWNRGHLVLNEAAVTAFHLEDGAVGRQLKVGDTTVTVVGVLKNFNFFPLQWAIAPFGLTISPDPDRDWSGGFGCLYVKIGPHVNVPTLIDAIRKIYTRYDARTPFEFQFLDDAYDSSYKREDQLAGLFNVFSIITIVIGCLGLFALATFAAQQRLKEIGIRKVLGASVASISVLLSRDFLLPILLSVGIASPLSWWAMHLWLENFAYRTQLSWWIFPVAGAVLLLVAQLTVLFRTIKAARVNPTINLRSE